MNFFKKVKSKSISELVAKFDKAVYDLEERLIWKYVLKNKRQTKESHRKKKP